MVEAVVTSVLEEALRQASERIAKKITEGKRLTSTDVIILLDQMNKRMEAMNESLNKRIDDLSASLNKRIDDTNRRIDDLNNSLNKRIDDTNKRIDEINKRIDEIKEDLKLLHQEVSRISRETGDDEIRALWQSATALHQNFYENWLPPDMVEGNIRDLTFSTAKAGRFPVCQPEASSYRVQGCVKTRA